jgi:hypothetical protein
MATERRQPVKKAGQPRLVPHVVDRKVGWVESDQIDRTIADDLVGDTPQLRLREPGLRDLAHSSTA